MLLQSAVRRVLVGALSALALAVFAAAPAGAAAAWFAPVDVSAVGALGAQVAVDPRGNTVAVWEADIGSNKVVQSAVRPAGGTWQAPVNISAVSRDQLDPQVAIDAQGTAVAVWSRDNGTDKIVQGAVLPTRGRWQAPVDLSSAGHSAFIPQVAIDARGNAVAVWQRYVSNDVIVVQGATRAAGGSWQAPVQLSSARGLRPQIAVDPLGNAVAVWVGPNSIVQGAVRAAGGGWQTPVNISTPGHDDEAISPQIAVDAQGDAVAVWQQSNASTFVVQGAVRAANGSWQTPVNISSPGHNAANAQVAVDPHGNAVAVWEHSRASSSFVVQGAVRAADASWQAPINLSAGSVNMSLPQVVVDPNANAIAIWSQDSSNLTSSIVQGAVRPAGGRWQAPTDITTADFNQLSSPDIAVDAHGNAVTIWDGATRPRYLEEGGQGSIVQSADYAIARPPVSAAVVTGLRLSPRAFRAGRAVRAVPPRATHVSYTLNVAASVRFTVRRLSAGRKVAARCVKATRSNRSHKSCPRLVRLRGSFTRRRPAGADRFAFNANISHTRVLLKPGRYRLVATPIANGRSGTPAHATFRIVR